MELKENIQLNVPFNCETHSIVKLIQKSGWNKTPQIKWKVSGDNYTLEKRINGYSITKVRRIWWNNSTQENESISRNLIQELTREITQIKMNPLVNIYKNLVRVVKQITPYYKVT